MSKSVEELIIEHSTRYLEHGKAGTQHRGYILSFDQLKQLVSALSIQQEADAKWLPIESAPHNQRVIVFSREADEECTAWLDRIDNRWYHAPQGGFLRFEPSHYMLLPEPPFDTAMATPTDSEDK